MVIYICDSSISLLGLGEVNAHQYDAHYLGSMMAMVMLMRVNMANHSCNSHVVC